jgi:transcription elongation GreA/GreB family factor
MIEEYILPFDDTTYQLHKQEITRIERQIKEFSELGISLENLNMAGYEKAKAYVAEVENRLLTIEKKVKK